MMEANMIKNKLIFLLVLLTLNCLNQTSFGCTCAGDPDITFEQYVSYNLKRSDLVFSGQMEKIEYQSLSKEEIEAIKSKLRPEVRSIIMPALEKDSDFKRFFYSFKPNLFWKGDPQNRILIFSTRIETLISKVGVGYSTCAYPFETEENYLVFASKVGDFFETTACGATGKLDRAQQVLNFLGKGIKYKPWYVFW